MSDSTNISAQKPSPAVLLGSSSCNTGFTSSHPPATSPDPTLESNQHRHHAEGRQSSAAAAAAELPSLKVKLRSALRQFPDFPSEGILFEDIMPIFADPILHEMLVTALVTHCQTAFGKVDAVVALESRGFLFGPSVALRLGAAFVPVRKQGKLPGPVERAEYQKEYGVDVFEMQQGAIKEGWRCVVMDDLIATGGSAAAAGTLISKMAGNLLEYIFLIELDFLKGRDKLDAPIYTLLSTQEK
ncbi:adenine phosphoribosyltransferase [Eremomyces bilateralis CBS 781.70]|uniref:adenine phosphoribosyltransferase n=1 Tax=Eremomyces bilateralis CBS 781.70 TaxID=1392243 RepID=A0A6G1GDJ9_9PEZI|nr:adenine phosphoribosyltransferase [Eremomyces bilateralis CBS 781.70]KAF1816185.1 adenine phosphoribosyltransferase [Eremomyces bilateralis CBS 781.70]